jgi:GTP cyclohydrolase IB
MTPTHNTQNLMVNNMTVPSLHSKHLEDVQGAVDTRQLPIARVGIRRLKWPLMWQTVHGVVHTVAEFEMTVSLPSTQKGTHMSRFIEALNDMTAAGTVWNPLTAKSFLSNLLIRLEAQEAFFTVTFDVFLPKAAPVTKTTALMNYCVTLHGYAHHQAIDLDLEVRVPVMSLCPCSKKIADYGAHNQRSHIHIRGATHDTLTHQLGIEDMIRWAEESASCALYPLLKRSDEKYVTEYAYNNPRFVEDLVREIALAAQRDGRLSEVRIEAENFESIHNHSAYAMIYVPNTVFLKN